MTSPEQPQPFSARRPAILLRGIAAVCTGVLVFVLTYASAWGSFRQVIVFGDLDFRFDALRFVSKLLHDFAQHKGRYPASVSELERPGVYSPSPGVDADSGFAVLKQYDGRIRYRRTEGGYSLDLYEEDGSPSGLGLDVEKDGDPRGRIRVERYASRFLLEGEWSRTLFLVACLSSLCVALVCCLAPQPPISSRPVLWASSLISIGLMVIAAVVVSSILILLYVGLNHH